MTTEDGWTVVAFAGDLDVASAPRLRSRLLDLVVVERPQLVVDLRGVTFVDSMGLGVLIGALRRARSHGGDVHLRAPSPAVLATLRLVDLDQVFTIDEGGS